VIFQLFQVPFLLETVRVITCSLILNGFDISKLPLCIYAHEFVQNWDSKITISEDMYLIKNFRCISILFLLVTPSLFTIVINNFSIAFNFQLDCRRWRVLLIIVAVVDVSHGVAWTNFKCSTRKYEKVHRTRSTFCFTLHRVSSWFQSTTSDLLSLLFSVFLFWILRWFYRILMNKINKQIRSLSRRVWLTWEILVDFSLHQICLADFLINIDINWRAKRMWIKGN
jgi:hypothetical protein